MYGPRAMRCLAIVVLSVGCATPGATPTPDAAPDGAPDAPPAPAGFGELSGMCGVLAAMQLDGPTPELFRDTITFARAFVDPTDRPLLTAGGRRLIETPNAGGSSALSEVFAFEVLARCEDATLVKTETEIVYDTTGKITDLSISIADRKLGVSVTRAVAFPFGDPYTLPAATQLLTRKLQDIQASTANVSAEDRWTKQLLAVIAWDAQAADVIAEAWAAADAPTRADTVVIVTVTEGDDQFLY